MIQFFLIIDENSGVLDFTNGTKDAEKKTPSKIRCFLYARRLRAVKEKAKPERTTILTIVIENFVKSDGS